MHRPWSTSSGTAGSVKPLTPCAVWIPALASPTTARATPMVPMAHRSTSRMYSSTAQ
jgi:hypothetical protein